MIGDRMEAGTLAFNLLRLVASRVVLSFVLLFWLAQPLSAQPQRTDLFRSRRERAFAQSPHALVIVTSQVRLGDAGVRQTPDFFYFTGLESMLGGVLVLDGPNRRARLFYVDSLPNVAAFIASIPPGRQDTLGLGSAGLDRIEPSSAFVPFVTQRLAEDSTLVLAVDINDGDQVEVGTPFEKGAGSTGRRLRSAIVSRWPKAHVENVSRKLAELRMVKDSSEIAALRRAGRASAAAFLAGLGAIRPGVRQRAVEGAVVASCMGSGAEGPSFWPWAMSGANGAYPRPWKSLADYRHADREIARRDLVRLDIGCEVDHYAGDVGRTIPASGVYEPGERETWEMLVAAYDAGVRKIADGIAVADILAASFREIERRQPSLKTALARAAAREILARKPPAWQIHGIGLESAEPVPDVLRAGMVIDYEPIFTVDGKGFYLEDMILVTPTGHEILTPGLPYTAVQVEAAMARRRAGGRS